MTYRTTFALDEATAQRLNRLAHRWKVSRAEVVRRAVKRAESDRDVPPSDPLSMLQSLHARGGGIDKARADRWIREIREDRKRWRGSG